MAPRPVKLRLLPRSVMKAKSLTVFPARVLGGDGILIEKANGVYTISVDADNLPAVVGLVIGVDVQAYDADLSALAINATLGLWTVTGPGTGAARTITGTSNRVTVTNGDGVSGNPTIDISSSYVGQGSITTLGTIGTGVWQGTKVGLAYGGTNADLSATGGTSQVLKQVSAGAAVTVGQLATTDLTGLGAGVATFLATPSSANLRSALTDEVGTGAAYFVGGALGTPASGTLTNATGLPIDAGTTGILPISRFTTGTPTGSKFVRDDGALAVPSGAGDMLAANNLSDLANKATSRTNLAVLGTAANLSDVASAATARTNLGAAPLASPAFTGNGTIAGTFGAGGTISLTAASLLVAWSGVTGVPAIGAGRSILVAVDTTVNCACTAGLAFFRDETHGGYALVAYDGGSGATIIAGTSNFSVTDPLSGGNKWFLQGSPNNGRFTNRYTTTATLSYLFYGTTTPTVL
jgi:hypothetical protein